MRGDENNRWGRNKTTRVTRQLGRGGGRLRDEERANKYTEGEGNAQAARTKAGRCRPGSAPLRSEMHGAARLGSAALCSQLRSGPTARPPGRCRYLRPLLPAVPARRCAPAAVRSVRRSGAARLTAPSGRKR